MRWEQAKKELLKDPARRKAYESKDWRYELNKWWINVKIWWKNR